MMYVQNSSCCWESLESCCSSGPDNFMDTASLYTRTCFLKRAVGIPVFSMSSHQPTYNVERERALPRAFCWGFHSTQSQGCKAMLEDRFSSKSMRDISTIINKHHLHQNRNNQFLNSYTEQARKEERSSFPLSRNPEVFYLCLWLFRVC